jgi:hypothetical protein
MTAGTGNGKCKMQRRNTGILRSAQNDGRLGCIEGDGLYDDFSMLEEKAVRAWRE